jgi:hypothetical protein
MWYVMTYILSALPLNRSYTNEECSHRDMYSRILKVDPNTTLELG